MDDANYHDYSGTATFTAEETKKVTEVLSRAGKLFGSISAPTLNGISNDEDLLLAVKTFNNSKIKKSEQIVDTKAHVRELFHYIHDKYEKEIEKRSTAAGKKAQEDKRKKILNFFAHHDQNQIVAIFDLVNVLVEAKAMIINKMNQAGHISTFLRTANGFKTTGVEGFVAIDHLTGGAVKIVDRMEFSKANFSADIIKGWQR
jgi:replicative DNA helicase